MRVGCHPLRPGVEDDSRRSTPSLRRPLGRIGDAIHATYDARSKSRACVRTSVLPSFHALFDFSPVGIAMIVQPRRRRSGSHHPRPIPIPTGGSPRPPRGRIPPRPFRGGPRTCPRAVGSMKRSLSATRAGGGNDTINERELLPVCIQAPSRASRSSLENDRFVRRSSWAQRTVGFTRFALLRATCPPYNAIWG